MKDAFTMHPFELSDRSHQSWAKVDLEFLPHSDAIDDLDLCFHMKTRWELQLMRTIAKIDDMALHKELGFESIADFVCARFGLGYRRSWEFVEIALCLRHLPHLEAAFACNEISYDHLRALIQIANDENEQELLELTKTLSVADTYRMVRLVLDVSKEESVEARKERSLETWWDHSSRMYELYGRFPQEMGARLAKVIDTYAQRMPEDPLDEGYGTLMSTKRADALYDLVLGSIPDEKRSANVVVHVEATVLSSGRGQAEVEGGPTISPDSVRRLMCDGSLQVVVDGSDGRPIGFGRTKRTAPPRMRQELIKRDRGCRWPGCPRTKVLEAHHIKEWGKNQGPTDFDSMVMLCEHHHDLLHNGGYKVIGCPPYTKILAPGGYIIQNGPPGIPLGGSAMFALESELVRAGPQGTARLDDS